MSIKYAFLTKFAVDPRFSKDAQIRNALSYVPNYYKNKDLLQNLQQSSEDYAKSAVLKASRLWFNNASLLDKLILALSQMFGWKSNTFNSFTNYLNKAGNNAKKSFQKAFVTQYSGDFKKDSQQMNPAFVNYINKFTGDIKNTLNADKENEKAYSSGDDSNSNFINRMLYNYAKPGLVNTFNKQIQDYKSNAKQKYNNPIKEQDISNFLKKDEEQKTWKDWVYDKYNDARAIYNLSRNKGKNMIEAIYNNAPYTRKWQLIQTQSPNIQKALEDFNLVAQAQQAFSKMYDEVKSQGEQQRVSPNTTGERYTQQAPIPNAVKNTDA